MIWYIGVATLIYFFRFRFGMKRIGVMAHRSYVPYNHKADMVEMILNMFMVVVGLSIVIFHLMKPTYFCI